MGGVQKTIAPWTVLQSEGISLVGLSMERNKYFFTMPKISENVFKQECEQHYGAYLGEGPRTVKGKNLNQ